MEQEVITGKIIACAFKVHNTLGAGFLEKVYERVFKLESEKSGFKVESQIPLKPPEMVSLADMLVFVYLGMKGASSFNTEFLTDHFVAGLSYLQQPGNALYDLSVALV